MLLPKLLFLTLCYCMAYGSQSSEEVEAMLSTPEGAAALRAAVRESYNEDRLTIINDMLTEAQETFPNVTVIGKQNIYGQNGDIVEIRTVELHIPSTNAIPEEEGDGNDTSMAEMKKIFGEISKIGLLMEIAAEEYDDDGDLSGGAYMSNDITYSLEDEVHSVNTTTRVNDIRQVDEAIKELKKKHSSVAVHKYDSDGQFLSEESTIVPEYVTRIAEVEGEVSKDILRTVQEEFASVYLKNQNEKDKVTSELSKHLGLKFPDTDFYVFYYKPEAWYMKKDFIISVDFDFVDWEEGEVEPYSIIGVKKGGTVRSN